MDTNCYDVFLGWEWEAKVGEWKGTYYGCEMVSMLKDWNSKLDLLLVNACRPVGRWRY